jgi:hypothetical protein
VRGYAAIFSDRMTQLTLQSYKSGLVAAAAAVVVVFL